MRGMQAVWARGHQFRVSSRLSGGGASVVSLVRRYSTERPSHAWRFTGILGFSINVHKCELLDAGNCHANESIINRGLIEIILSSACDCGRTVSSHRRFLFGLSLAAAIQP
jgi:hypothetical protein